MVPADKANISKNDWPNVCEENLPTKALERNDWTRFPAQICETGQTKTPGTPSPTPRDNTADHAMLKTQETPGGL